MAHLLVANGTHQNIDFHYRVPEHTKIFSTVIPAGRQVELPVDLNTVQAQKVVEQLERYGARPASDIDSIDSPRGLIYTVGKVIKSDQIDAAREQDVDIRQKIADEQVENAGVATPALNGETGAHLKESTLEVRELEPTTTERAVRGGVDTKVTVSTRASGGRQRNRG
jgi:hypothetical protein